MLITFDIPNNKLLRISDALDREGFIYNPEDPDTEFQQRRKFFREMTIKYWQSLVFNHERQVAINNEPNDTAALQAARFEGLDDVTSTEE